MYTPLKAGIFPPLLHIPLSGVSPPEGYKNPNVKTPQGTEIPWFRAIFTPFKFSIKALKNTSIPFLYFVLCRLGRIIYTTFKL